MAPENLVIGSTDSNSAGIPRLRAHYQDQQETDGHDAIEIDEEELSSEGGNDVIYRLSTIREEVGTVFSYDFDGGEDAVYMVVGKASEEESSMDALMWTVNNAVINKSSTVVFLVHVFPETRLIPSPLGMLPVNQVNPEQKTIYMIHQKTKRREFLQKFINVCVASQVKVDTILVESNAQAKALLNLIHALHIGKIVLGATKSTIRKMRSRKGNTMADEILQNAPEFCDVKIIYEGKEMSELAWDLLSFSSLASTSSRLSDISLKHVKDEVQTSGEQATCGCFKL